VDGKNFCRAGKPDGGRGRTGVDGEVYEHAHGSLAERLLAALAPDNPDMQ
jgi:hypothetical protein